MVLNELRSYIPRAVGGVDKKEIVDVRRQLIDNLPDNGTVEGKIEFLEMDDEDLRSETYSGLEEVEAAYETWMAEHDPDKEKLTCNLYQGSNGGKFEIRLEEIDNLHTSEWTGAHHPPNHHDRDSYDEVGDYESIRSVTTGDTLAVLEGEYRREV